MSKQREKELRDAIIEAVPEIRLRNISVIIGKPFSGIVNYRDDVVRLGDVLATIDDPKMHLTCDGRIIHNGIEVALWNLGETFDNQPNKTKTFLYNLLVKNGAKTTKTA